MCRSASGQSTHEQCTRVGGTKKGRSFCTNIHNTLVLEAREKVGKDNPERSRQQQNTPGAATGTERQDRYQDSDGNAVSAGCPKTAKGKGQELLCKPQFLLQGNSFSRPPGEEDRHKGHLVCTGPDELSPKDLVPTPQLRHGQASSPYMRRRHRAVCARKNGPRQTSSNSVGTSLHCFMRYLCWGTPHTSNERSPHIIIPSS